MSVTVRFSCKDPLIREHCERNFASLFAADLNAKPKRRQQLVTLMEAVLVSEARRQQWYDYTEDEDGRRQRVEDHMGNYVLLVPGLEVVG